MAFEDVWKPLMKVRPEMWFDSEKEPSDVKCTGNMEYYSTKENVNINIELQNTVIQLPL